MSGNKLMYNHASSILTGSVEKSELSRVSLKSEISTKYIVQNETFINLFNNIIKEVADENKDEFELKHKEHTKRLTLTELREKLNLLESGKILKTESFSSKDYLHGLIQRYKTEIEDEKKLIDEQLINNRTVSKKKDPTWQEIEDLNQIINDLETEFITNPTDIEKLGLIKKNDKILSEYCNKYNRSLYEVTGNLQQTSENLDIGQDEDIEEQENETESDSTNVQAPANEVSESVTDGDAKANEVPNNTTENVHPVASEPHRPRKIAKISSNETDSPFSDYNSSIYYRLINKVKFNGVNYNGVSYNDVKFQIQEAKLIAEKAKKERMAKEEEERKLREEQEKKKQEEIKIKQQQLQEQRLFEEQKKLRQEMEKYKKLREEREREEERASAEAEDAEASSNESSSTDSSSDSSSSDESSSDEEDKEPENNQKDNDSSDESDSQDSSDSSD
ncbi:unnamed protein product [[Candida] boidinii]|uniref:Unnamed protein product n=1 Tax=Candida boidinii TaxID=5477 RepID=A0A9W6WE77_CANBO|nr:hypothetical protein B5S30_g2356 [[Candida] boidinii]OWB83317.1 hypothetical protein B5S33_g1946 [[Candida] boidinii]GME66722.1 unnamed protein product [[Candida] boidinii]GMF99114.1 unnamed protein product [[Candida] boidinii]